MLFYEPLDTSVLTPQLTIDDLKQTKVTTQQNKHENNRIKQLICIAEMWNMKSAAFMFL